MRLLLLGVGFGYLPKILIRMTSLWLRDFAIGPPILCGPFHYSSTSCSNHLLSFTSYCNHFSHPEPGRRSSCSPEAPTEPPLAQPSTSQQHRSAKAAPSHHPSSTASPPKPSHMPPSAASGSATGPSGSAAGPSQPPPPVHHHYLTTAPSEAELRSR
ncbi:probable pathogenesis-related protein ARB_02861 [Zingiber officinale]|uniref:probable pathogenesis-related protein ARB_02861 n=1 Tax=Zingiber officinale TaxID=94328 RepID=UPI001C4AD728|nr:probable pathogenesis-related protein ARB_02861 [Zingiber officinale]